MALTGFRGIDHLVISASDVDESIRFYTDLFGWEQEWDEYMEGEDFAALIGIEGAHGRAVGGHIGGMRVEFVRMSWNPTAPRTEGTGLSIFTVVVDDAMKAYEECKAKGVKFIQGGTPQMTKGCLIFFIEGPDGQQIEIVEFTRDSDSPWAKPAITWT